MLLLVNADNVTGEGVPYLIEGLMDRGASSVHAVPAITKKGRSEFLFLVDAPRDRLEEVGTFLALELDTLGMRVFEPEHFPFNPVGKITVAVKPSGGGPGFPGVRVKTIAGSDGKVFSCKAEYEDLVKSLGEISADRPFSFKNLKASVELAAISESPVSLCGLVFEPETGRDC